MTGLRFAPMGQPAGCRICGSPLTFHQQVAGQICGNWRCRTGVLEREMASHRERAGRSLGIGDFAAYAMVVVPDDPRGVQRQPMFRQKAHVNWLFDLCLKTLSATPLADDREGNACRTDENEPPSLATGVCAVCRGTCCHLGGDHAFLDQPAIRSFIAHSGICDPLEIVYAFAARLPRRAVVEGCVYQTQTGCALPRWMRAGICNAYRCKGLRQAEDLIHERQTGRFYVVVREDNQIQRGAFLDDRRIRHFPPDTG
jgi:hypothetical protein